MRNRVERTRIWTRQGKVVDSIRETTHRDERTKVLENEVVSKTDGFFVGHDEEI